MTLRTFLIITHLISMVVGLGAATTADLLILRVFSRNRINEAEYDQINVVATAAALGLILLIGTGFGFLVFYQSQNPEALTNSKLWAKLTIVGVLALNGLFLHKKVLPLFKLSLNRPLNQVPEIRKYSSPLFAHGAVSFLSWYSALILGAWKELNFGSSYAKILAIYGFALACSIVFSVIIGRFLLKADDSVQAKDELAQRRTDRLLQKEVSSRMAN